MMCDLLDRCLKADATWIHIKTCKDAAIRKCGTSSNLLLFLGAAKFVEKYFPRNQLISSILHPIQITTCFTIPANWSNRQILFLKCFLLLFLWMLAARWLLSSLGWQMERAGPRGKASSERFEC